MLTGNAMTEHDFQMIRSIAFVGAAGLAVALQRLKPHASLPGAWRDNGAFWVVNLFVLSAACGACACSVALWAQSRGLGVLNWWRLPAPVAVAFTVIGLDLVSYAWHRANHRIPLLWRFHQVHHSDATFTVSTGVRFHPGELLLSLPLRLAAVIAFGAQPVGILLFESVFTVANLIEHGDIALPAGVEARLGRWFITPALHRWHHTRELRNLSTNFGTIFAVWDRLLGTYADNPSRTLVTTGLPGQRGRIAFWEALLLPIRTAS